MAPLQAPVLLCAKNAGALPPPDATSEPPGLSWQAYRATLWGERRQWLSVPVVDDIQQTRDEGNPAASSEASGRSFLCRLPRFVRRRCGTCACSDDGKAFGDRPPSPAQPSGTRPHLQRPTQVREAARGNGRIATCLPFRRQPSRSSLAAAASSSGRPTPPQALQRPLSPDPRGSWRWRRWQSRPWI